MRVRTVIALLSGLALFSSEAACREARAAGTITRRDAETCQVVVDFTWVGEDWPPYEYRTCHDYYRIEPFPGTYISLSGPFGTPEQMSEGSNVSYSDDYVSWWGDFHVHGVAFNFKPASTQTDIAISYSVSEDCLLWMYSCDQPEPCAELQR